MFKLFKCPFGDADGKEVAFADIDGRHFVVGFRVVIAVFCRFIFERRVQVILQVIDMG